MQLLSLAWKSILDKKIRFVLTTLAVVFGVAFTVAVFITTDSLRATFGDLAEDIAGQVDLTVRSEQEFGERIDAALVDPALAEEIAVLPGVAAADAGNVAANVRIIDEDGDPIGDLGQGPPQLGVNWSENPDLTELFLNEGRQPETVDEFAVNTSTADDEDLVIGETYTVQFPTGNRELTLVGTANFADPDDDRAVGANVVALDTDASTELLNGGAGWNEIRVDVSPDADVLVVQQEIREILPSGTEVVTNEVVADETADDFNEFIDIIQNVLLAFAVVILLVSGFLIYNTFAIIIGQRVREFGLLRALGASGRQITQSVIAESAVVGVIATVVGLLGGVGMAFVLRAIFGAVGFDLPEGPVELNPPTIISAVVIGMGVTMVSALFPAVRARRVTPMAALRDDVSLDDHADGDRNPVLGAVFVGLGVLALVLGMAAEWGGLFLGSIVAIVCVSFGARRLDPTLGRAGTLVIGAVLLVTAAVADFGTTKLLVALAIGALAMFIGVNQLSPTFARPVARTIGAPLPSFAGVSGQLSRENAARAPQRTASTASALMIGLALVGTVTIIGSSLKATFIEVLDRSVTADWFMCVGNCNDPTQGFSQVFADELEELPELESVIAYRFREEGFRVVSTGDVEDVQSADFALLSEHLDIDPVAGDLTAVGPEGIVVYEDAAEDLGLAVGDPLEVEFTTGETATFTVEAVYGDDRIFSGGWIISNEAWDDYFVSDLDQFVSAVNAPGVDDEQARAAIQPVNDEFPEVDVRTKEEFRDNQVEQVDQFLIVVNVFLGLAVIIALMGIINTLVLSIFERTRELGLLRAVGMNRSQMRRMIRWEGVIVAVFGGILGMALGILFGTITAIVIPDSFIDTVDIPYVTLIVYVVVAGIAGLLAAIYPAWRAGRLNVLEAISHE